MTHQYANIVTTVYKSAKDMELAIERVRGLIAEAQRTPGFRATVFVQTGETTTQHVALYDSEAQAEAGAQALLDRFEEAIEPHVAGQPSLTSGRVVINVTSTGPSGGA